MDIEPPTPSCEKSTQKKETLNLNCEQRANKVAVNKYLIGERMHSHIRDKRVKD